MQMFAIYILFLKGRKREKDEDKELGNCRVSVSNQVVEMSFDVGLQ